MGGERGCAIVYTGNGGKYVKLQTEAIMATNLSIKERSFVSKNFQNVSQLENYFMRNLKELQNRWRVLESYVLISSTSFIHSQTHNKSKEHKRFSTNSKCFYTRYETFLFVGVL
jgi:23S rRNA G2445 N2-methylase RlmL